VADNKLYYGDNLDILRRHIEKETVDLIYLDPPFNSNQNYNVLFAERNGGGSSAQIKAFEDTWRWDQVAAAAYQDVVTTRRKGRVYERRDNAVVYIVRLCGGRIRVTTAKWRSSGTVRRLTEGARHNYRKLAQKQLLTRIRRMLPQLETLSSEINSQWALMASAAITPLPSRCMPFGH